MEDPVKRDLEKMMREREGGEALVRSKRPPKNAVEVVNRAERIDEGEEFGRKTLDPKVWSKIEGTPYFDRSSKAEQKRRNREKSGGNKLYQSRVALDDYSFPKGREAVDAELPKGKRVFAGWKPQGTGQLRDPPPIEIVTNANAEGSGEQ